MQAYLGVNIPAESREGDDREASVMRAVVRRQEEMARIGLEGAGREGPTAQGPPTALSASVSPAKADEGRDEATAVDFPGAAAAQ